MAIKLKKNFSSQNEKVAAESNGKKFTIDEIKDMKSLIESDDKTFDLIMLWIGSKVRSSDIINDGIYRGYRDEKNGLNQVINNFDTDLQNKEVKDELSDRLVKLLRKLGIKYDSLEILNNKMDDKGAITRLRFMISFKDNEDTWNKAIDSISKKLKPYNKKMNTTHNLRYEDKNSGTEFYFKRNEGMEDGDGYIIVGSIGNDGGIEKS